MIKKIPIWPFDDYKKYLKALVKENSQTSGFKSRLAKGAGCQRSFLSQALNGTVHLTLDHAAQLSEYLHLSDLERDYLIEMMSLARAGSSALQKITRQKMKSLSEQASDLSRRVHLKSLPEGMAEAVYYSSWYYAAVHSSLAIKGISRVDQISLQLKIESKIVLRTLQGLQKIGLVENSGKGWQLTSESIHLPKNSPYSAVNQFNWRQKAIQKLQSSDSDGIHYTGLFVLKPETQKKIEQLLLDSIESVHDLVTHSDCEKLTVLNCDFFEL